MKCNLFECCISTVEPLFSLIKSEGEEYIVVGGGASDGGCAGLGGFWCEYGIGGAYAAFGFLGCANEEIAQHLGKYFGMLITEAKYGDIVDFEIVEAIHYD